MSVDEQKLSFKQEHTKLNSAIKVNKQKIMSVALSVLETESAAIKSLEKHIDDYFVKACEWILNCRGRLIVTGIGKSGHIANKIAATMASTGTPSFFLHPAEALHGDLGMLTSDDILLVLSHSGETDEIMKILPIVKRLSVPIITLTGKKQSTLAMLSDICLDVSVQKEACPLGLAPTASTTAALAMGDALALSLIEARGFTASDFAKSHPGGKLGRRLLLKIEDIMHTNEAIPRITEKGLIKDAIIEMTKKRLGFINIVSADDPDELIGVFTDGDLRRVIEAGLDLHLTPVEQVMSRGCKSITVGTLAVEAITIMEKPPLSFVLPVLNKEGKLIGSLNMHDIFKAGVL